MFGLLNIDKPRGITSRDVVNRVQRLVKPIKVGHAGTLDPLATGVLIVAIGPATRLIEYVQRMPKTYLATFQLGKMSDTEDIEGEVVALTDPPVPAEEELRAVLQKFTGVITQQPPAYSALKVGGKRAYALARRGEAVELAPRLVEIHEINVVRYQYPELELLVRCGSGTYVRSLGRDIARALGTDAVMSALRRDAIGPFLAASAIIDDQLSLPLIQERLLPPALALGDLPRLTVTANDQARLVRGQSIGNRLSITAAEAAAVDESGNLIALLQPRAEQLWPCKCFVQS